MYCMVVSKISFPALQNSPWDVTLFGGACEVPGLCAVGVE